MDNPDEELAMDLRQRLLALVNRIRACYHHASTSDAVRILVRSQTPRHAFGNATPECAGFRGRAILAASCKVDWDLGRSRMCNNRAVGRGSSVLYSYSVNAML